MKILIDNGHGKETSGKRSPDGRLKEYAYTREIADRVVIELQNEGIDAMRIVPEENDVTLSERVKRVNAFGKEAILISQYNSVKIFFILSINLLTNLIILNRFPAHQLV